MEGKKMAPPTQQQQQQLLLRQQQQQQLPPAEPQYSQPPRYPQHIQAQPNGVIHQPPVRAHHPQAISPKSPLLENHQDLYGTRQQTELSRQYAIREQNMQIAAQRAEQQRNIPMVNSSYSLQSPTRDPILSAPVPPGYNASVHQAYLRRNQHQLNIPDQQQIYQNHQSLYQPANVQTQQQQPRLYQPYTSRIKQTSPGYLSPGHSYTQLLRQNYNELQQMKLQQQMQYQSQAQLQQQQTFAQRQILHQHLHSRQQSQQNLNQYGTTKQTTTAQLNEVNSRLQKSEQNDYAMQPYQNSKQQLRQNQSQSPLVHMPTSPGSKEPLSSPSTKSPSSSESRRSSSGTGQALRSPIAQRPLSAPVTKAGWLYKQGSDGLKVWRKRWFVLSEYCLFYYKGQEEDKLLGSVLLPSYKVSLCTADDKVMRKFAFKCEHANMRTYVLAAHDQDLMNQWVHVLTMAALMQEGSSGEKSQQYSTGLNIPNSERRSKTPVNMDQDDITPEISGAIQPMYENAPPKPRRSNEGYNSPSPEKSMERYDPNYDILREPSYKHGENPQARSQNNRLGSKSPLPGSPDVVYDSKTGATTGNYVMQRNLTKSPEGVYNSHNLSLPLTNTHNNRLENNKSLVNYQDASNLSSTNSRLDQNKSPAYFDSRNLRQDPQRQNYPVENQNVYNEMNNRMTEQYAQEIQNQQAYQQNTPSQVPSERQAFERRTPDTYGRSAIVPGYYSKGRAGDYEDVYHQPQGGNAEGLYGEQSYRRPQSPISYEDDKLTPNTLQQQIYGQANIDNGKMYQAPPVQVRQKKKSNNYSAPVLPQNVVPRPHSADFLEYEAKNSLYNPKSSSLYSSQASRQPPRPKSSLDINTYNDYNGDSYYYSEASYAEKMRQSAHYLRNKNFGNPRALGPLSPVEFSSQRKLSMPIFRRNETNESSYESDMRTDGEALYGGRDQNRNVSGNGSKYSEITGPNSNWTLRNKSLSHIMGQEELYNRSNSAMSEGSSVSGALGGEQFTRSASARLPSTSTDHLPYREGEKKVQQREESMKRLLEWKQRMLQSPLTRKTTPTTLSLARSLHHARSPAAAATTAGHTFPKSSSRLPAHLQHNNYNSYSSDDEEQSAEVVASAEPDTAVTGQAGRPSPLPPPPTPPPPPLHPSPPSHAPTSSAGQQDNFTAPAGNSDAAKLAEHPAAVQQASESESEMQFEITDDDFDEIFAKLDNEEEIQSGRKSVMKNVCDVRKSSDTMKQRFPDYEICEINQNETVLDDGSGTLQRRNKDVPPKQETPPLPAGEDHYMPMSPKKAVLALEPAHTEIIKNISVFESIDHHEDNPYVEMSQGIGIESAFSNEEMQAYEIVCVSSSTIEPVYMELNNLPDKNVLDDKSDSSSSKMLPSKTPDAKDYPHKSILRKHTSDSKLSSKTPYRNDVKSPLPDILIASQGKDTSNKSDSSDADDESSKDISLEKAYSRFSLSDSFRPASYYPETKSKSSSPPPAPTTMPPLEEPTISTNTRYLADLTKSEENIENLAKKTLPRKSTSLMIYGNTPSMYDTIFKGERVKRNRASLPPDPENTRQAKPSEDSKRSSLDSKSIPPSYKTSGSTDTDSLLSYNADRGSSRMSMDSDISSKFELSTPGGSFRLESRPSYGIPSDGMSLNDGEEFIELRHPKPQSDSEIEKMLKRRPLSDDSCFDIESLNSQFNENLEDINLDHYLGELQTNDNSQAISNNIYSPRKPMNIANYQLLQGGSMALDITNVGYLNERIAAIREEVQYENINISENMERSRSRNSNLSNTISDPDTVNTFITVRPVSRMSNSSTISGLSSSNLKTASGASVRSISRNSLPLESSGHSNTNDACHTRHASFEKPTMSYYSKNTSYFDSEASILKNLNNCMNQEGSLNKVNISEMIKMTKNNEEQNANEASIKASISHSRDSSNEQSAPYYYSDLSSQDNLNLTSNCITASNKNVIFNKLNNQRRKGPLGKKSDITHIHNPIHSNLTYNHITEAEDGPIQIAEAARCVSVEFLSAADKTADIDHKNIYESDTLKRQKVRDSMTCLDSSISSKNIYPSVHDKISVDNVSMSPGFVQNFESQNAVERNRSLEQMLQNVVLSGNKLPLQTNLHVNQSRSQSVLADPISTSTQSALSSHNLDANQTFPLESSSRRENRNIYVDSPRMMISKPGNSRNTETPTCEGEDLWDEDSLWTENLRRVSHRHARSLDHLDCLEGAAGASGRRSVDLKTMLMSTEEDVSPSGRRSARISRDVKYVNENIKGHRPLSSKRRPYKKHNRNIKNSAKMNMCDLSNEHDVYVQLASDKIETIVVDDGVYEQLATEFIKSKDTKKSCETKEDIFLSEGTETEGEKKKFEIDREKLRQWDLMSSGLLREGEGGGGGGGGESQEGERKHSGTATASVSVSGVGMDGVSRSAGKKPLAGSASTTPIPVRAVSPRVRVAAEQAYNGHHQDTWPMHNLSQTLSAEDSWSVSRSPSRQASSHQPVRAVSPRVRRASDIDERNVSTLWEPMMNVSAGELLGRSHEELVLLLIQLRRRRAATGQAMEQCWAQIQSVQSRICAEELMDQRHEDMQRLEQLRQHLAELERHYEKSKPLVHLVDNMVKLGTLYNRGNGVGDGGTLERLEMNQINRERQLAEEKRWAMSAEMLSREQVEQKVEQLRAMERCVAGEAGALRGLRREREALQRALGGAHLQQDLSRVHHMLAINSKKLEQTVAGNARLEQELSVLRHKLQQQGQQPGAGPHTPDTSAADTTAMLEDELKRVQQLVGDLQKQRQELSVAVRQLTDKSQGLGLMSPPLSTLMSNSSTDLAGSAGKKRNHSTWTETDLDSNNLHDESSTNSGRGLLPLYIDTHSTQGASSPSPSDEPSQNSAFSNLTNVEKQEIKTVRIVKRESERRQRDRERSLQPGNPDWSAQNSVSALDQLLEEDFQHSRSTSLPRGYQSNPPQALTHNNSSAYQAQALPTTYMYQKDNNLSAYSQKSHANPPNTLSLTNVNIPFDNMSISSISSSNRYISSPSLVNNNDYLGNHEMHNGPSHRYAGYQNHSSNQILPLPTSYSISKHSSAPYLESPEEYKRPVVNGLSSKVVSASSLSKGTAELSPVFTSEAARQIIIEMSGEKSVGAKGDGSQHRRQVPREKRRHYTAPHHLSAKSLLATDNEDDIFLQEQWCRARDDVDMERVLRGRAARGPPPLVAPPDLVRSTLPPPTQPEHYSEHTIDRLLAAPNKILIPERYIPEQAPELSPEEQQKRREKVESIKKMLSNSTPSGDPSKSPDGEDKRQREHLLQLNQILAKQVMEMSKIVAEKALKTLPADGESSGESDLSPDVELPLYQQRDNFFT